LRRKEPKAASSGKSDVSRELLFGMYRTMLRIRVFEERTGDLVEAGEVGTPCHLYVGQEAIAAGVCAVLGEKDYIWGTHRSHGHYIAKGGDMKAMMAEIFGRAAGCAGGRGGSMHLVAPEIGMMGSVPIVAGTIPMAVGAALAVKLRGEKRVSVAFFGDGSTEEGHFHESMNIAALHRLPVLFVLENNLYASHLHILERRPKDNLVEAAEFHGMPGLRIDGNDAVEVYRSAREASGRARSGEGPTLMECRTYRWRGHVGPSTDMDVGVKRKGELGEWMKQDPIARLRERLSAMGMGAPEFAEAERSAIREVDEAVAFARGAPYPDPSSLADHVYAAGGGGEA